MTRYNMTAQFVAHLQGALQVDTLSHGPTGQVRHCNRLCADLHLVPVVPQAYDRQANTVTRNGRPHVDPACIVARGDPRAQIALLLQCSDCADVRYDAGKHSANSYSDA